MYKRELKKSFIDTILVMTGYVVLVQLVF